jgi:hypothetical protein
VWYRDVFPSAIDVKPDEIIRRQYQYLGDEYTGALVDLAANV